MNTAGSAILQMYYSTRSYFFGDDMSSRNLQDNGSGTYAELTVGSHVYMLADDLHQHVTVGDISSAR